MIDNLVQVRLNAHTSVDCLTSVQAAVVTARGDILTASSTENPDLFWGIRGAGCNFGVVTEFVLRLHPQRRTVFGGILAYPPPLITNVVTTLAKIWESGLSEKEAINFAQTADPAGNVRTFHLHLRSSIPDMG